MTTPEDSTENNEDNNNAGNGDTEGTAGDTGAERSGFGPAEGRPLGFWLRVVDARLTREFATILAPDHLDRRDWMILNVIAGAVDAGPFAKRLERGGRRVRALVDRGWVTGEPGSWALTDEGRAAFARLGEKVAAFRARVAGASSPEDFATTLATLEAIAAELGGDERDARGFGRWRGHRGRPGFGPWGFGGHRGFGPWDRDPEGNGHHEHGHGHGHGHPHHHGHRECGHDGGVSWERGYAEHRGHGAPAPHTEV